jgi:chaperonin GroEL (HSP60 family)
VDMLNENVLEPKRVVAQAVRSAADIASQLIRVELITTAKPMSEIGDNDFQF